jgi:DNA-binding transcriptional LysR family regulator
MKQEFIMDRLTGLETFVRVVELGSLTAAAQERNLSVTMISNHVRALEGRLGARLLNRTTRRQSLTEIGRAYYEQCVDILARIASAESNARESHSVPRGRLRISAPVTLGSHLLVPALAEYLRDFPQVEVELLLNDRLVDLVEEGFDAVLRFGKLSDSRLVVRPLHGLNRMVCASPAYLARHGTPVKPHDLANHNCVAFYYIAPESEWHFAGKETATINVTGQLTINNGPALLVAALSGIGIVMLPDYLAAPDVAAGRLVRLFSGYDFPRAPLQLVYLPDRHMTPKLRSFVEFIRARLA